jgi:uncharacterized protein
MNKLLFRVIEFTQRHARLVIVLTAVLTVALGWFALRIKVNPETSTLIPESPKSLRLIQKYGRESLTTDFVVVTAETPDLFTVGKLAQYAGLIDRIEKLPRMHPGVSPFNFITFRRDGARLAFDTMAAGEPSPSTPEAVEAFRARLLAEPQAKNRVVSADGTALCVLFPVDMASDYRPALAAIEGEMAPLAETLGLRLAGGPLYNRAILEHMYADLPLFLGLGLLIVLVSYYLSFRTLRSLVLPVLVVILGTVWTTGVMRLLGFELTIINIMTPPLVLILGSSYSLHVLNQYYREARTSGGDRRWISDSVGHIVTTIFLASITTVFGFASLLTASLPQLREFGISTGIGIIFCAALAILFLPAALSLLRQPTAVQRDRVLEGTLTRHMGFLARLILRHRVIVLAGAGVIAAGFALTVGTIRYDTDFTRYFRGRERAVEDNNAFLEKFGGYVSVNFSLNAPDGSANYFLDPAVLRQVALLEDDLRADPDVAAISSFTAYVRGMNRAMTGDDQVPEARPLILLLSKYFRALSSTPAGRNATGKLLNSDYSQLTFVLRVWDSRKGTFAFEEYLPRILARIQAAAKARLPAEVEAEFWGHTIAVLSLSELLTRNQVTSILTSALLVFLVSALVFRSAKLGLLVLAPLATGIMMNFIVMAIFRIPLDVVTITFSSIAIGIGVDNAIHLTIQYKRQSAIHAGDPERTIEHTLKVAGRPMMLTTLSIMSALFAFTFSRFRPIAYFGLLISLSLLFTTLGALILLPVLLYGDARRNARRAARQAAEAQG